MQTILIADAHHLCREALCNYIRHTGHDYAIECAGDYGELVAGLAAQSADLVLVGLDLPGFREEMAVDLRGPAESATKVGLIVPVTNTRQNWGDTISGVFPKSLSCKAFVGGIGEILEGRTFFPSVDAGAYMALQNASRTGPQDYNLTPREKQVLSHLVKGESNKEIARALDLQVVTVKLHVRGICRKMNVSNRTQAALCAKENGWG